MADAAIDVGALQPFVRAELARRRLLDFCMLMDPSYTPARHLVLLCEYLEALERREIRKLIVAMPPRHGKSRTCSQLFPAWTIGRRPQSSVVLASYGSELAEQNSRRVRDLVNDAAYPFTAVKLREDSRAVNRWATNAGGLMIAAGVGSALTGFGISNVGVIDDPVRDREAAESPSIRASTWDWFTDVARTRSQSGSALLVISTRWHEDDLVGRIEASPEGSQWTKLVLPAICEGEDDPLGRSPGDLLWPEAYPLSELPSVASGSISSRSFAALYMQQPMPAQGGLIKAAWLQRYDSVPNGLRIIMALDAAAKVGVENDYSALVVLGSNKSHHHVLDVIRRKVDFPDLRRLVLSAYEQHHPSAIYVEDTSNAVGLIQELRRETSLPIVPVTAKGSKIARVEAITGLIESGRVLLPDERKVTAPWCAQFETELLGFPGAKHDDGVDALALALSKAQPAYQFYFAKLSNPPMPVGRW